MNLTFILKVLNIVSSGRWGGGGAAWPRRRLGLLELARCCGRDPPACNMVA